jgi:prophage regulatory protein
MEAPTAPLTTLSPLTKVLTRAALKAVGIPLSNPTLGRMERAGTFPKRFYLSAKTPVWSAAAVTEWLAARQAATEPNRVTAKATATRTRRRQAKAVNAELM